MPTYDLDARRVCDTLEVYLQRGNGDEEAFKYRLSAEEQALLLTKMNTYCQEHWGQSLEECNADLSAEAEPGTPRDADVAPVAPCEPLCAAFSGQSTVYPSRGKRAEFGALSKGAGS